MSNNKHIVNVELATKKLHKPQSLSDFLQNFKQASASLKTARKALFNREVKSWQ